MSQNLTLDYNNFENSKLSDEYDIKGNFKSVSEYITKNCNCVCKSIPNSNQEDMSDDAWTLSFKEDELLSKFCEKYNYSIKDDFLVKNEPEKKLKKKK